MKCSNGEAFTVPPPGVAADPVRTPAECEGMTARRVAADTRAKRAKVNRERWAMLNAFADAVLADAGPAAGAVWLVLFRYAKPDGTAFASLGKLETMTGIHRRSIQRAVCRLVDLGALEKVQRGGGAVASVYRLKPPAGGVAKSDLTGGRKCLTTVSLNKRYAPASLTGAGGDGNGDGT